MKISEFTAFSESKTKAAWASFEFDTSFTNTNFVFRSLCEKKRAQITFGYAFSSFTLAVFSLIQPTVNIFLTAFRDAVWETH